MRNRNRWTTFTDAPIAEWRAVLPIPPEGSAVEPLIQFVQRVMEAGEQERIYRVLPIPGQSPYYNLDGRSYADALREFVFQTGELPLFSAGVLSTPPKFRSLRTVTRIAFYDELGKIREEEIENIGLLLQRLRPKDIETGGGSMRGAVALDVNGPVLIVDPKSGRVPPWEWGPRAVHFGLPTDIWFPLTLGLLEEPHDHKTGLPFDMYDNSVLAQRHTPRLNRFFAAVRKAIVDIGGQWELAESESPPFAPMCTEEGVTLDLPPMAQA